jgi:hypothetical protein
MWNFSGALGVLVLANAHRPGGEDHEQPPSGIP